MQIGKSLNSYLCKSSIFNLKSHIVFVIFVSFVVKFLEVPHAENT
jgi:hypothetical protein